MHMSHSGIDQLTCAAAPLLQSLVAPEQLPLHAVIATKQDHKLPFCTWGTDAWTWQCHTHSQSSYLQQRR